MATKHIKDATWRKVEKKTVDAVIHTKSNIKESDVLDYVINLGLQKFSEEDYEKLKK
ncbi:hypothetical protein [Vibrio parahaemolyticus]|uniref:hypothetical protein n=1 Tax=Vibrio parahaemolyticus TaxID=670 RepID=UPI000405945E|nr:hypothetical protein [Vibrio parahaemolyticus]EIE1223073.1 hypothetical protein [Vibrio parahaemolyticus]EIE1261103.1 hypothetical protein [Vibrio parahaemolyticus]EIE1338902.1 hypothetical protein [Vibrio parahaemolyticus]EIV8637617.1 hypothetical protein [Vibrio parahaemolyticus]EIZ1450379.1 hypothetical protein [Vibrio parahaemolyticus]